jgi:hypothetical protein
VELSAQPLISARRFRRQSCRPVCHDSPRASGIPIRKAVCVQALGTYFPFDHKETSLATPANHLLDLLLNTFREWGSTSIPNIAILDWGGLPTAHEFVVLQEFFTSHGVPSLICAPEQLTYQNRKLRCDAFPIDLVYKRVIINELLAKCEDSHPLIRAYIAGDVCLVNSFRCKVVHKRRRWWRTASVSANVAGVQRRFRDSRVFRSALP